MPVSPGIQPRIPAVASPIAVTPLCAVAYPIAVTPLGAVASPIAATPLRAVTPLCAVTPLGAVACPIAATGLGPVSSANALALTSLVTGTARGLRGLSHRTRVERREPGQPPREILSHSRGRARPISAIQPARLVACPLVVGV